jgi:hypothetical protein
VAPKLTEDDAFLSNVPAGFFVYRIPDPHTLLGVPQSQLGSYDTLVFWVEVEAMDADEVHNLACKT